MVAHTHLFFLSGSYLRLMQNLLKCLPSGNNWTSDPSSFLYLSSIDLPGILSHLSNIPTTERKRSIVQHSICRHFYLLATIVILENQKGKKMAVLCISIQYEIYLNPIFHSFLSVDAIY
jgi:hypothetical protein